MAVSLLRYLVITYLLARYVFIRPSSNRKISLVFSWLRLDPCVVTSLLPPMVYVCFNSSFLSRVARV